MNTTTNKLADKARRIVGLQVSAGMVSAMVFLVLQGMMQGLAALYGALSSIVLVFLLSRGVKRASEVALHDPKKSMMILYLGAVQRFILLLVLFALGLAVLKLDPLACLIGFGLAQLTYVIAAKLD